jgi:hypothetical protein
MKGPIRIDYPERRLTFFSKAPACPAPIALDMLNGVPRVTVTLRPVRDAPATILHLIVDLGTRHFAAIIGGRFLETAAGKAMMSRGKAERIGTGTGGTIAGVTVRAAELGLGTHRYRDLSIALTRQVVAFNKGLADGTLGVPLWVDGAITFDETNRRLCLSR